MKWTFCGRQFSYDRLELAHCKVAVLGAPKCGKTTMIQRYGAAKVQQSEPELYDIYRATCDIPNHQGVQLEIWDYPGDATSSEISLSSDIDVIILCVDVSRPSTLDAVTIKWLRLIREQCPKQGIFLVGCKCDLRNDLDTITRLAARRQIAVTFTEALLTAKLAGAIAYVEVSALRCPTTVTQVFEVAALHHVGKLTKRHLVYQRQRSVEKHRRQKSQSSSRATSSSSTSSNNNVPRRLPFLVKNKGKLQCGIM